MKQLLSIIIAAILITGCMTAKIGREEKKSVGEVYFEQLPHAGIIYIGCFGKVHSVCGTGSGTLFRTPTSDRYYVVTNAHVLIDDEEHILTDNAVLELDDGTRLQLKPLIAGQTGTSNDVGIAEVLGYKVGDLENKSLLITKSLLMDVLPREDQRLVQIGAPRGIKSVLSTGYIFGFYIPNWGFAHTAETQPGSSGSLVYTMDGQVAGITWGIFKNKDLQFSLAAPASSIEEMLIVLGLL